MFATIEVLEQLTMFMYISEIIHSLKWITNILLYM